MAVPLAGVAVARLADPATGISIPLVRTEAPSFKTPTTGITIGGIPPTFPRTTPPGFFPPAPPPLGIVPDTGLFGAGAAACNLLTGRARELCLAALGVILPPGPGTGGQGVGLTVPCPPTVPGCPGFDPTPGVATPAEVSVGAPGLQAPFAVQRTHLQCPVFGNGKVGILWMSGLDGTIVCLPRGVNGLQFGLVRKNPPGPKPLFTGGDMKCLRKAERLQKKFRKIDKLFGATAKKRGR